MKAQAFKSAEERLAFAQGLLAGLQIAWRMVLEDAVELNAAGHVGNAQAVTGAADRLRDKRETLMTEYGEPPRT